MSNPNFPGNDHASGAMRFSGWARNGHKPTPDDLTPEAQAYREYAQTQATLALAYEQRTANLIAAYGTSDLIEFDTILARLGLDGAK